MPFPRRASFVTTGTFTRDAVREATRDGGTPIDLMDGDQLADKLKELKLGIKIRMVESVEVDIEWFGNIQTALYPWNTVESPWIRLNSSM